MFVREDPDGDFIPQRARASTAMVLAKFALITYCFTTRRVNIKMMSFQYRNSHYEMTWWDHHILTLNMLNCFKDYRRCIPVYHHILDFVQQKKIRFTMEQPHMLPILYCQYHACWCPGDVRSQGISRHGIDQISQNILSAALEELIMEISVPGEVVYILK